jgi:hypothetical protein
MSQLNNLCKKSLTILANIKLEQKEPNIKPELKPKLEVKVSDYVLGIIFKQMKI